MAEGLYSFSVTVHEESDRIGDPCYVKIWVDHAAEVVYAEEFVIAFSHQLDKFIILHAKGRSGGVVIITDKLVEKLSELIRQLLDKIEAWNQDRLSKSGKAWVDRVEIEYTECLSDIMEGVPAELGINGQCS